MNNRTLRCALLVLLSITLFMSCDHRLDPNPLGRFQLKTVSYNARTVNGTPRQSRTYLLSYNQRGLLSSYLFSFTQGNGLFSRFYSVTRDAQDRVIEAGDTDIGNYLTYEYTAPNRLSQVRTFNRTRDFNDPNQPLISTLTRRYGYVYTTPDGLLPVRRGYLESQLTINNAEEEYTFVNGNAVTINQVNYTYDDKPNPYYGLVGFNAFTTFEQNPQFSRPAGTPFDNSDYFADIQVKVFNKNNMTNNAQLTYNADGLVTRIVYANGNTEDFTYEVKP